MMLELFVSLNCVFAKIASGVYPPLPPGVLSGPVGDVTSGGRGRRCGSLFGQLWSAASSTLS